jgi:hypothetical protein
MGSLGDYLMEELSLKTSFTIPIGGGIPVSQSAVARQGNTMLPSFARMAARLPPSPPSSRT